MMDTASAPEVVGPVSSIQLEDQPVNCACGAFTELSAWICGNLPLYHSRHVYHSIKILAFRNFHRVLHRQDGWYVALYHDWEIDDHVSVLDL